MGRTGGRGAGAEGWQVHSLSVCLLSLSLYRQLHITRSGSTGSTGSTVAAAAWADEWAGSQSVRQAGRQTGRQGVCAGYGLTPHDARDDLAAKH